MGIYNDQVVPRMVNIVCGAKPMGALRRRALTQASGHVLELGFGSGTNLEHYPDAVTKVFAVEPSMVGRNLGAKRVAATHIEVEYVGLEGESVPLPDASVDNAVSTWTLCTIPDAPQALSEVRRVLRPGGKLYFLEHGLSDLPKIAARQQRWNGMQQRLAGGCNLNRRIDSLVADAGFVDIECQRFMIAGPKVMSCMYAGSGTAP